MTKEQFNSLLHSPSTINLNMVKGLEEITAQFPYFRNAHLLLAKQYQGHENIRYESYLRKAAAYAADRRILYNLIKLEPETIIHMHRDEPEIELTRQPESSTPTPQESNEQTPDIQQPSLQAILQAETSAEDKFDYELSESNSYDQNEIISEVQDVVNTVATPETNDAAVEIENNFQAPSNEMNLVSNSESESETELVDEVNISKSPELENVLVDENANSQSPEFESESEDEEAISQSQEIEEDVEEPAETQQVISEKTEIDTEIHHEETSVTEAASEENIVEINDPKTLIENRLREIANPKRDEPEILNQDQEENEVTTPLAEPVDLNKNKYTEISDPVQPAAPAVEKTFLPKEEVKKPIEHHTFLDWLKLKDIPVLPVDRNRDYFGSAQPRHLDADGNPIDPEDELIENFIKTEPRIVPAKSEFYSPGNMARQSAMEHEDLISETLARIYAQQGNIPKAIDAYRRLSLKIPEKSSYFAALIRELEESNPL